MQIIQAQKKEEKPKTDEENKPETPKEDFLGSVKTEEKEEKPMDTEASEPSVSSVPLIPLQKATAPSAPECLIDLKSSQSPFEAAAIALKSVLDKEKEQEIEKISLPSVNKKNEENEDSGFNLIDIEKEMKLIQCVEQLKSMGYTDDAGWLTRLVIAKEGNINAILDALQPSK